MAMENDRKYNLGMLKFMKRKFFNFVSKRYYMALNHKVVKNQVGSRNFYAVIEYLREQKKNNHLGV